MSSSTSSKVKTDDRDRPLREDVRLLGSLLGDTIRRFEGDKLFDVVERFRLLSKAVHTEPTAELKKELFDLVESLDAETAGKVIKAAGMSDPIDRQIHVVALRRAIERAHSA